MNLKYLIFIIYFLSLICFNVAANQNIENYIKKISNNYLELSKASNELAENAKKNCINSPKKFLKNSKHNFNELILIWGQVQHIRFGPINDFNNYSRIQFWPDKRGVVHRQFKKVLLTKPEYVLDYGELGLKSVAIQGLPVLEKILFDEFTKEDDTKKSLFLCGYLFSVSKNLEAIFNYNHSVWNNESELFQYFEKENFLNELFNSVLSQIEFISKHKLENKIKKSQINLKKEEFWRSNNSLNILYQNLESIILFYDQLVRSDLIEKNKNLGSEIDSILKEIKNFINEGEKKNMKYNVNLYEVLFVLNQNIKHFEKKLLNEVSSLLSINIGFNKMDGD